MSIRNATIAMRKRKIGLFEQERGAAPNETLARRISKSSAKGGKKRDLPPPKAIWALWQEVG